MDNQTRMPGRYGIEEIESSQLEAWPNPNPERDYVAHFEIPEFTCLCPRSGFPDFATIDILIRHVIYDDRGKVGEARSWAQAGKLWNLKMSHVIPLRVWVRPSFQLA